MSKLFLLFLLLLQLSRIEGQKKKPKGAKGMGRMFDITGDLDDIPIDPEEPPQASESDEGITEVSTEKHDAQQPPKDFKPRLGKAVKEAPCETKGGQLRLEIGELCSLPPEKGRGKDDVFRYYYNPVVQMCLPFSYSGKGGNANRFVSVKNCYEICHPSEPSVKKPRVVSGIKAYLAPNVKNACLDKKRARERQADNELVVRQMPHPLDPRKTLTIIQSAKYVDRPDQYNYPSLDGNTRRLYQYEEVPHYVDQSGQGWGHPVYKERGV